jgi:photosystem II stability/assembly factor-like uncharacterized protein
MKKILVLFSLILISTAIHAQNQWVSLNSAPNATLTSVYFVSADTGYISTFGGTVYKTTNGGLNFNQVNNNGPAFSLCFLNAHKGFGAHDNYLLVTQNSGNTWNTSYTNSNFMEINNICFPDKKHGFATAYSNDMISYLLWTNNGGTSWDTISIHDPYYPWFKSIFFKDSLNGYIGSDVGRIYKTMNGGTSFFPITLANAGEINSIYFPTTDTGYATALDKGVYKTIDGGNTWNHLNYNFLANLNSVWFVDANNGFVGGGDDINYMVLYKTNNGGNSWSQCLTGTHSLNAMFFVDNMPGYAVGNGIVLKYTNTTGIADNLLSDVNINLYPNPATDKLSVEVPFGIFSDKSAVSIYSVQGQLLLQNKINTERTELNISELANGVYFIKLTTLDGSLVRKFVKE